MTNKSKYLVVVALLAAIVCFASCKKTKSNACEITSFTVAGERWTVEKTGNPILIFPEKVYSLKSDNVSNLSPVIEISRGAKLNHPLSGKPHDFSDGKTVPFIVTAEDGKTTKTYRATARVQ